MWIECEITKNRAEGELNRQIFVRHEHGVERYITNVEDLDLRRNLVRVRVRETNSTYAQIVVAARVVPPPVVVLRSCLVDYAARS